MNDLQKFSKKNDPFGNVQFLQDAVFQLIKDITYDTERLMNDVLQEPIRFNSVFQGLEMHKTVTMILNSYLISPMAGFPNEEIFGKALMELLLWMRMEGVDARKAAEKGIKYFQELSAQHERLKQEKVDKVG